MKLYWLVLSLASLMAADRGVSRLEVSGGEASFAATTNVSAITVHGKSTQLRAQAAFRSDSGGLTLENIDARLDAASLNTGMSLRDQHMREKIFQIPGGAMPELRFEAPRATCPAPAAGKQAACEVSGAFHLRGQSHPMTISLKLRQAGRNAESYRVTGEGKLKLSDYGIEPPAQLGIRVADLVSVKLEFTAGAAQ